MMKFSTFIILMAILTTSGCEKAEYLVESTPTVGSGNLNTCNKTSFAGISSISEVKDISLKIHWNNEIASLGYTVFKRKGTEDFEFVESVGPGTIDYSVNNLTELTEYSFLVKYIGPNTLHDCNDTVATQTTSARQTFKSCYDISQYYGAGAASGEYEIDFDLGGPKPPINVYCEMDRNNGGWTRILVHKTSAGNFSSDVEALEKNSNSTSADIYSILTHVEDLKRDSKFEFWLHYPEIDGTDNGNHWTQTSNPAVDAIANYVPISVDHTSQRWGGLEKSSSNHTLIDGSVSHGNWFYAIGSNRAWPSAGSIPGPSAGVSEVYLYIR